MDKLLLAIRNNIKTFLKIEFIRYLIAGGVNTITGYVLYFFMIKIIPYLVAYTIVYIVGIIFSYLLFTFFVFKSKHKFSKFLQFPLVYLAQYVIGVFTLAIMVDLLNFDKLVAMVIMILISMPITFFFSKKILKKV